MLLSFQSTPKLFSYYYIIILSLSQHLYCFLKIKIDLIKYQKVINRTIFSKIIFFYCSILSWSVAPELSSKYPLHLRDME